MAVSRQQIETDRALIRELREVVGNENVLSEPDELLVYECDGLPQHKHPPRAVVFPTSTPETSDVLQVLSQHGVSFAPRGAGTGLSGGALAVNRGVIVELARMREILQIDIQNRLAIVQTGLVNALLSRAVAPHGLYYVPDPSSQPACTIGGNLAENAGGIHCLKYGTTTDHVLAARIVLSDGSVVDLDGKRAGYDLLGVFVGSEGTFGIATEATLRLSPIPPAVRTLLADFLDVNDASRAVSAIIAAGILPAALEMMDNAIIRAVEASVFTAGLPTDAQAVLLVELDGIEAGIDDEAEKAANILKSHGARGVRRAADETERKKLWAARKGAFGAVGRLLPDVMIQDAVVPRSRLPEVLAETYRISAQYNLQLANVFHAGDGNLHPLICFDLRKGADLDRVRQAGREIMETCVRAGGSITGEHGIGLDKSSYLPLIFSQDDMDVMLQVRAAFDTSGLCNPGKIIPTPRGCGEARAVATQSFTEPLAVPAASAEEPTAERSLEPTRRDSPAQVSEEATSTRQKKSLITARLNEARLARELARIVGDGGVRRLTDLALDLKSGARAERILEISPASLAQASEVMRFASRQNLAVIPGGGETWLRIGNLLTAADLVISTRRMDRMVKHEPADLVATAEAGMRLSDLQKQLAAAAQYLPIDPATAEDATLGGIVAANRSSGVRPFIIGMRAVLADGRAVKAGGNVVKNVAGYDLCKLFTGSYGTLAFITELTFKLRPLPAETRTVVASGELQTLIAAGGIIAMQLFPRKVEMLSPRMSKYLRLDRRTEASTLLARFEGEPRAVISQTAQALKLVRSDARNQCMAMDHDTAPWRQLGAAVEADDDLAWRVSLKPTDLLSFMRELPALETDGSHKMLRWHAALDSGELCVIARAPVYHREAVRALERLRETAGKFGGSLVVEKAPKEIKDEFDSWGGFGSTAELMKRIKQQLDPQNILSPGRMSI